MLFHYVLRKLVRRIGNNALTIMVIGLVLAGCILGTEFLLGLRAATRDSLPADHVLVMGKGAMTETQGSIEADQIKAIEVLPGIREAGGVRAASREVVAQMLIQAELTSTQREEPLMLRGVDPIGFQLHDTQIVKGRLPARGEAELVIGAQLAKQYPLLTIGSDIYLPTETWKVVGVFSAGGSVYENEAWGDRTRMMTALKQDYVNSVTLAAGSVADATQLISTINATKQLDATASFERDARGSQARLQQVTRVIAILVLALGIIGIFVTATNLHASLVSRLPELVTFVALGVRRQRVASLMLLESVLLSGLGAVVAVGLALLFQGKSSAMFSSAATFELRLGALPILFAAGIALIVGLLGGLVPALMVRRIDVIHGLR